MFSGEPMATAEAVFNGEPKQAFRNASIVVFASVRLLLRPLHSPLPVIGLKTDMYLKRGGIAPTVGLAMYVLYSTRWKSPYTL
jgi:hypothetical protein